ncbi:MAG: hypothetical protein HOV71_23575 [Hamadaea sp.]|nr:hypothetical protein [Hamadaea sp.]NUR51119.1 hypothetical protein [Hamadaea sp.]NUT05527.1 hypothetical protein [Hamadaea sp.]
MNAIRLAVTFTSLFGQAESHRPSGVEMTAEKQGSGEVWLVFRYVGSGGNSWTAYEKL